jgi:hypothetical protein
MAQGTKDSSAKSANGAADALAARQAALAGTKAAGHAVTAAASRAKTPLIVGGAAMAGIAGGLAATRRVTGSRPRGRRRKVDLDAVASAARGVGALGNQVADIATVVQATRQGRHK